MFERLKRLVLRPESRPTPAEIPSPESFVTLPPGWRYGLHPHAVGAKIRSFERLDLPVGETLRLEMVNADRGVEDMVLVQYYISTFAGRWALWISCAAGDLPSHEVPFHAMTPTFMAVP